MKNDALDFFVFDLFAGGQFLQNVPGNGFSFSIRVGGEDNRVGIFNRGDNIIQAFFAAGAEFPCHGKVFVRIDRAVFAGQVADVAEAGKNFVIAAEGFVNGFGFGG